MLYSSTRPNSLKKKTAEIKKDDKALNAFTWANLLLMLNTGIVGLIKAIPNLHSTKHQPVPMIELATNSSTLLITAIFALLATAMNHTRHHKKYQELILKAQKLRRNHPNLNPDLEQTIQNTCKKAWMIDQAVTWLSYLLILAFIISAGISALARAKGNIAASAIADIVGNSAYLLAMLLTIAKKIIGSLWQNRTEKKHFGPYQSSAKRPRNSLKTTFARLWGYNRANPPEETLAILNNNSSAEIGQEYIAVNKL